MKDFGLLLLRLTVGGLLTGHGAQKVFGWFGGPGLKGVQHRSEELGMRPGEVWGTVNAFGEFGGGVLTLLGFLEPLGPLAIAADMAVAIRRVHLGKPIWASAGGAELPLIDLSAALALAFLGPGRYSLDRLLGFRLPRWIVGLLTLSAVAVAAAASFRPEIAEKALRKAREILSPGQPPSASMPETSPQPPASGESAENPTPP